MSPFGLKFSQMILHTETSKLMYNASFLFVVLHKPTLLPSTFNEVQYTVNHRLGWIWIEISILKASCLVVGLYYFS